MLILSSNRRKILVIRHIRTYVCLINVKINQLKSELKLKLREKRQVERNGEGEGEKEKLN